MHDERAFLAGPGVVELTELDDGRYRFSLLRRSVPGYRGWGVVPTFVTDLSRRGTKLTKLTITHVRGDDSPALTARMLRAVRPEYLRIRAIEALDLEEYVTRTGLREPAAAIADAETLASLRDAQKPMGSRRGRKPKWTELELSRFAERYVDAAGAAKGPIPRLAEELSLSFSTVSGLVVRARKEELLTSVGQGKAGGKLTPRAQRVLKQGES